MCAAGLIWREAHSLYSDGLVDYAADLWNIVDFITNVFYMVWISLRFSSWYIVQVSLTVNLLQASSGKVRWVGRYLYRFLNFLNVQNTLTWKIIVTMYLYGYIGYNGFPDLLEKIKTLCEYRISSLSIFILTTYSIMAL